VSVVQHLRRILERLLESVCVLLMVGLAVVVVLAVIFRKAGASLVWYDEVAAIMLVWLTYYGAALAALRRAHLGFPTLIEASPRGLRVPARAGAHFEAWQYSPTGAGGSSACLIPRVQSGETGA
jgi:TRAP-type C4-dicarboxylate transport system permease small subunit